MKPQLSEYITPLLLRNGHTHTIFAYTRRRDGGVAYQRERITTADDDFLDLDWLKNKQSDHLVIISHGLEASSNTGYVCSLAGKLHRAGHTVLAWNFRGCSGEPNRHIYSYHSGKSEDLAAVISHAVTVENPRFISLVGFSIGGNITLKYLGEAGSKVSSKILCAVTCSTPVDLAGSASEMASFRNWIYMKRFLNHFYRRMKEKKKIYPEVDISGFSKLKNFHDYDNRYTAPLNGYKNAEHYWQENSSLYYLSEIKVATLMLSSYDDPFLSKSCYPEIKNMHIQTLYTKHGGHVGFMNDYSGRSLWSEEMILGFINDKQSKAVKTN